MHRRQIARVPGIARLLPMGGRDRARCPYAGAQSMMDVMESTRVDRWLWAVRLTKTRPDAAAACRGGHVRVNDRTAKPSTLVSPGDEVRARGR
jgi:ribosomal protein S4